MLEGEWSEGVEESVLVCGSSVSRGDPKVLKSTVSKLLPNPLSSHGERFRPGRVPGPHRGGPRASSTDFDEREERSRVRVRS